MRHFRATHAPALVLVLALGASLAAGCGGGGGEPDASPGDSSIGDAGPPLVTPPAPPAPPAAANRVCAPGWIAGDPSTSGSAACLPWPLDASCDGPGLVLLPGEGCVHLGPECPADPAAFATNLPADRPIVYVRAGATAPGAGTVASPYPTIVQALAAATPGSVIALSNGVFDEVLFVPANVTLWGACAGGTRTRLVRAMTAGGGLRQLSIASTVSGIEVYGGATLSVTDVVVERAVGAGVAVAGTLDGTGLAVRDVAPDAAGQFGYGLVANEGGTVRLDRVAIERAASFGVFVQQVGTTAELANVSIRDIRRTRATGRGGSGAQAQDGASLVLRHFVVEQTGFGGVEAISRSASAELEDGLVRAVGQGDAPDPHARGIRAGSTSSLSARQVEIVDTHGAGVVATALRTSVVVDEVWVRRTVASVDGTPGAGLSATGGASLRATRTVVVGADTGASAYEADTTLELEDADVSAGATAPSGAGLEIGDGAVATVRRMLLHGAAQTGVLVQGAGASATLEDVELRDVGLDPSLRGVGIAIQTGAQASLSRVAVLGAREVALLVLGDGARVDGGDVRIERVASSAADGFFGHGLHAQAGGVIDLARVEIRAAHTMGIAAVSAGAQVTLSQAAVLETLHAQCETTTCPGNGAGSAIFVIDGASVRATDFVVSDAASCGLQLAGGTADLERGLVRRCKIGANVVPADFDLARIMRDVRYLENERALDSSTLPLPPSTPPALR